MGLGRAPMPTTLNCHLYWMLLQCLPLDQRRKYMRAEHDRPRQGKAVSPVWVRLACPPPSAENIVITPETSTPTYAHLRPPPVASRLAPAQPPRLVLPRPAASWNRFLLSTSSRPGGHPLASYCCAPLPPWRRQGWSHALRGVGPPQTLISPPKLRSRGSGRVRLARQGIRRHTAYYARNLALNLQDQ
jgi:hypothetical protein